MRKPRSRHESRVLHLYPKTRLCPACAHPLKERYRKQRFIIRLSESLHVISHFLECGRPGCR